MKKNKLMLGIIFLACSVPLLIAALNVKTTIGSSLFGLSGTFFGFGAKSIYDYWYWSRPDKKIQYEEKLEEANILSHDERLVRLREKSGRYAYLVGLAISTISIWIFMILEWLELMKPNRILFIFLGGYVLFQLFIGIVIFNYLNKKY